MALSKLQLRDRDEWFAKLRTQVKAKGALTITLRKGGASFHDIQAQMGSGIACELKANGTVVLAVVRKPEPEAAPVAEVEAAS